MEDKNRYCSLGVALTSAATVLVGAGPPGHAMEPAHRAVPSWCPQEGTPAELDALPRRIPVDRCDMRGKRIDIGGGVTMTVPRENGWVSARVIGLRDADAVRAGYDPAEDAVLLESGTPPEEESPEPGDRIAERDACNDSSWASTKLSWRRSSTIRWKYYFDGQTGGLDEGDFAREIVRGVSNAVNAVTDCTPEKRFTPAPNIRAEFLGKSDARPNIGANGSCSRRDGQSVIGLGEMRGVEPWVLGVSCAWQVWRHTVEGDVLLRAKGRPWWLSGVSKGRCPANHYDLASAATHEALHLLGLGHTDGKAHSALTMAPVIKACDTGASTLGWGDYLGLLRLYGPKGEG